MASWHEAARDELTESATFYERRIESLGERFLSEVEATVARILCAPLMPRCFENGCRRLLVHHFPFAVIYRVKGDEVQILAVAHAKRRPGYWKQRSK